MLLSNFDGVDQIPIACVMFSRSSEYIVHSFMCWVISFTFKHLVLLFNVSKWLKITFTMQLITSGYDANNIW